jgi:hypothetical protein
MGYFDLEPVAFLVSEAVRNTNTAEEAALYDQWIRKCNEKLYGKEKLATDQDNEFPER